MISSADKVVENASYVSKLLIRPDIVDVFFISSTSGFCLKIGFEIELECRLAVESVHFQ